MHAAATKGPATSLSVVEIFVHIITRRHIHACNETIKNLDWANLVPAVLHNLPRIHVHKPIFV